ncbi:rim15, signal transduction response regulator [Linderina macrospora]|uniref:Rim15, signal transduction response regulator n=1 Tax=Linderina macrospora TaxID=4868 RepID=A0ACC1J8T8_9FUNG|nr:rim15, signal transduction response regulator [Linderina macrospora]
MIKSAPIQRHKTTPARLLEEPETPEESPHEKPQAIPIAVRSKDDDELPPLDDDPEFGGFTFKNLHALEQANFNEIVKLRRRSTLMDIANHPLPQNPEHRTSHELPQWRRVMSGSSSGSAYSGSSGSHSGVVGSHSAFSASTDITPTTPTMLTPTTPSAFTIPIHTRASSTSLSRRGSLLNPRNELATSNRSSSGKAIASGHLQASNPPLSMPGSSASTLSVHTPPASTQTLSKSKSSLTTSPQLGSAIKQTVSMQVPRTRTDSSASAMDQPRVPFMKSRLCLVADDNPVCCKIMEMLLARQHMQCVIVRNGAEAIRCAMGRTVFRAIFMDVGMPIVDGDEATRMIKSTFNVNRDTPIIAMAVYDGEATDILYDRTIVKPITGLQIKHALNPNHSKK